ncbi:hypothetical protein N7533_008394 [Penicillium manginii]|uniref:uncharacterized protein n=1 Tax=Penicillium manginii TaxID=203109 RepID=UPI0025491B04|nr:uncharacterized protein N7533_008394 [Penicillium manginii]KAJ5751366.1 hypothetical protein N7533_008394 [Penicillium manginii]
MADASDDDKLCGKLVMKFCQILDSAGVPNVLWGNYLLTIYGVPTITDDVAFVVPDDKIKKASSALEQSGLPPCAKQLSCPHLRGFQARPPSEHVHVSDELALSLYRKSDTLWEFEGLHGGQFEKPLDILSASDVRLPSAIPGRGRGRLSPEYSLVRIPSAARFCEALILLLCRDYNTIYETYWMALLTYILEYVDETDIFDVNNLADEYKEFFFALKKGDSSMFLLLDQLRCTLFSSGRLSIEYT